MAARTKPANIIPITKAKRTSRKQSFTDLAAQTITVDSSIVPLDPVERYAWDRTWEWLIKTTQPYTMDCIQEDDAKKIRKAA